MPNVFYFLVNDRPMSYHTKYTHPPRTISPSKHWKPVSLHDQLRSQKTPASTLLSHFSIKYSITSSPCVLPPHTSRLPPRIHTPTSPQRAHPKQSTLFYTLYLKPNRKNTMPPSTTSSVSGSSSGKGKTILTIGKPPGPKPCWCGDDCQCCIIPCTVM